MSLESKKKHDIMFSDPELDSIFSHFILNYVPGLYLYFFLYMVINPLLWREKDTTIYYKAITNWIESTREQIIISLPMQSGDTWPNLK